MTEQEAMDRIKSARERELEARCEALSEALGAMIDDASATYDALGEAYGKHAVGVTVGQFGRLALARRVLAQGGAA